MLASTCSPRVTRRRIRRSTNWHKSGQQSRTSPARRNIRRCLSRAATSATSTATYWTASTRRSFRETCSSGPACCSIPGRYAARRQGGRKRRKENSLLRRRRRRRRPPTEPNRSRPGGAQNSDFSNLDFLAETAAVLLNLAPDEQGVVTISRDDLGGHQHVHILAVDPRGDRLSQRGVARSGSRALPICDWPTVSIRKPISRSRNASPSLPRGTSSSCPTS